MRTNAVPGRPGLSGYFAACLHVHTVLCPLLSSDGPAGAVPLPLQEPPGRGLGTGMGSRPTSLSQGHLGSLQRATRDPAPPPPSSPALRLPLGSERWEALAGAPRTAEERPGEAPLTRLPPRGAPVWAKAVLLHPPPRPCERPPHEVPLPSLPPPPASGCSSGRCCSPNPTRLVKCAIFWKDLDGYNNGK